jgi:hypothetical protein
MTERRKRALKRTGDHSLDLERMQFEKDMGRVSTHTDYVIKRTKQGNVQAAMEEKSSGRS